MHRIARRTFMQMAVAAAPPAADWRDIAHGHIIPDEGYCDQPYVVVLDDGSWLCTMTTGAGVEGQSGQHVAATISRDKGRTWSPLIDIEPAGGPEASWAMPLKTPSGRVYVFYTYNGDNVREVPGAESAGIARRVDTLGHYVFKYSDAGGRTWSKESYRIPLREMAIDRENNFGGKVQLFWGVGKPIVRDRDVFFGFSKVGWQGAPGTFVRSESCVLRSPNILTERDPSKIRWQMLPQGDSGLRAPRGPIAEELNLAPLSDGSLYAVYRTIDGYLCHAYSRDNGRTWTPPEYATYIPGGRRIKQPRAFGLVRRFSNGKYLLWFHNHGGEAVLAKENWQYYMERNPGWVAGGIERGGRIWWSEPEILLYDDDPAVRISYPDFIEDSGRYWIAETQKEIARVHEIDRTLLEGLWSQFDNRSIAPGHAPAMPELPDLAAGGGFTLDFDSVFKDLRSGQTLLDTREANGRGVLLATSARSTLKLTLSDGRREASWDSDPGTHPGTLRVNVRQHVSVIVDGGPRLILFVIDGVLNDGGAVRQYGWGRFSKDLTNVNGRRSVKAASAISNLRVYPRALRVSEAIGNARASR